MKLSAEEIDERFGIITDKMLVAIKRVKTKLSTEDLDDEEALLNFEKDKIYTLSCCNISSSLTDEELASEPLSVSKRRQHMSNVVLDTTREPLHPLTKLYLKFWNLALVFLKTDLNQEDVEAFKAEFHELLRAHIKVQEIKPNVLEYMNSVFKTLLGVMISIATLGVLYVFDKTYDWNCSFFTWPKSTEKRHDPFEGKYEDELNGELCDEIVKASTPPSSTSS